MQKKNKLEVFCYYLRATPNISATELGRIKAEGEQIISAFRKGQRINTEFREEIESYKKRLKEVEGASETIDDIELTAITISEASEPKSILKKSTNTAPVFGSAISFSLFPTINKISKEGKGEHVNAKNLFPRFVRMLEVLADSYGTKESCVFFLDLCVDFFNESTLIPKIHEIESQALFPIVNELFLAAIKCNTLERAECPDFFVTTITRVLMAFKPFLKEADHEDMIDKLFQHLSRAVQCSNELEEENDDILDLMFTVINGEEYVMQTIKM